MSGHVIENSKDGGPEGMHVDDISAKNGMDAKKLARILRILATYHIFKEVSPDVFANNRISSSLDTGILFDAGILFDEIIRKPEDKFRATSSAGALAALLDVPSTYSPFGLDAAMTGTSQVGNIREVLTGFEWSELPEGSLVVDGGGGVGTSTQVLYDEYKHLNYVILYAHSSWTTYRPEALTSGHVLLQDPIHFRNPRALKRISPTGIALSSVLIRILSDHVITTARTCYGSYGLIPAYLGIITSSRHNHTVSHVLHTSFALVRQVALRLELS
ncbi:hypothetical protein OBBRIDRAFT_804817 [Obba rivulosa]|uniref:Uncharacterized protein n=1 Tax=Obba rivulosa TaxID=1052685 RepID=A0A8E2B175_9APHY|nr:hypothetical protein OBBRIDRAFT_804817 [Obba rivulosa]